MLEIAALESLDQVRVDRCHTGPVLNNAYFSMHFIPKISHIRILVTVPEAIRVASPFACWIVPSLLHYHHTFEHSINLRKSIFQMDSQSLLSVKGQPGFPNGSRIAAAIPRSKHLRRFVGLSGENNRCKSSSLFRFQVSGHSFFIFRCWFGFGYLYLY